ncbi:MAG: hypothetical protein ACU84J_04830 [Gammaproteobacteria bacterium]
MKIEKVRTACLIGLLMVTGQALSYQDEKREERCVDPKIRDFNLPTYHVEDKIEVPPEAEMSFTLSAWTDPESISVTAKKIPLPLSIENKMSFFRVKAKLPASLNGQYVRIDVRAIAELGCKSQTGWLVKVANAEAVSKAEEDNAAVPNEQPISEPTTGNEVAEKPLE